jgi:hypothetical protein
VTTASGNFQVPLDISGKATPFDFTSRSAPLELTFDPEFNVFRRLHPVEIPPTVNSVKGAASLRIILAEAAGEEATAAANTLRISLGLERFPILRESEITAGITANHDLLWVGLPKNEDLRFFSGYRLSLDRSFFRLNSQNYRHPEDVFFGVFDHPRRSNGIVAVFLPLSPRSVEIAARKITHYGKYSYLVFRSGRNVEKGTWPVENSPLIHDFDS